MLWHNNNMKIIKLQQLVCWQKEDAQNAIIRNNLDMERTLGGCLELGCPTG